jgi:hypothetical protein
VLLLSSGVQAQAPKDQRAPYPVTDTEARRRLHNEPSVFDVQRAVLSHHQHHQRGAESNRMMWAAALPKQLEVRVSGQDEGDWTDTVYEEDGWRRRLGGESQFGWKVLVEWDLSRLVYHPHQLAMGRIQSMRYQMRKQAVDTAIQLYYERRRLQWDWLTGRGLSHEQRTRIWWRIRELRARLDAMSGGVFRKGANQWWREVAGGGRHP